MEKRLAKRIEGVGAILSLPEPAQLEKIEEYLKGYHEDAWSLLVFLANANLLTRKRSLRLLQGYKDWLEEADPAWGLSALVLPHLPTEDWDKLAALTGKSRETCRQVVQALKRGGMS